MGVSLHSKIHPLFMKYSNGTSTQCYAYQYLSLFPVLFSQSLYMSLFIYLSSLFSYLFSTNCMCIFSRNLKLNFLTYGENTIRSLSNQPVFSACACVYTETTGWFTICKPMYKKKFFELKRTYKDCRKREGNKLGYWYA